MAMSAVVSCTYPECGKEFPTVAAMKHHKAEDPAHDYCSKCDVDCDDWDDLIRHKVRAMEPWLATPRPAGSPRHIVCEFCGEDLKSLRGRETHRREKHVADQDILCPACGRVFVNGGQLLHHLESNACKHMSVAQFTERRTSTYLWEECVRRPDSCAATFPWDEIGTDSPRPTLEGLAPEPGGLGEAEARNLLHPRFWTPGSPDFDVDNFYAGNEEEYRCPLPVCGAHYDTASDLEAHLREYDHTRQLLQCRGCQDRFPTSAALMSHIETTERCGIRRSEHLHAAVNELSGGLLSVETVASSTQVLSHDGQGVMKLVVRSAPRL